MTTTGQNALNVGDSIIKGLEEALAYERGERSLRTRTAERTAREARVVAPPLYDSARIRAEIRAPKTGCTCSAVKKSPARPKGSRAARR